MSYQKGINFSLIMLIILMSCFSVGCTNDQSSPEISDITEIVENDVEAQSSNVSETTNVDENNSEENQQKSVQDNSGTVTEETGIIQPVGSPTPDTRLLPEQ